jgi:RRXRR protein
MHSSLPSEQRWVPVVSSTGTPLMPCRPVRARKLVQRGRAIKRWKNRLFYIQMLDLETGVTQPTALGIDPGSKREGYTVKASHRTFLNIQSHARDGKAIQKALEGRANARRARRNRNTPCRAPRFSNRERKEWIPPSTLARWQLKLNILKWLTQLYPISTVIIEDVKAITKPGKKRWNTSFSPIQAGKNWFYDRIRAIGLSILKVEGKTTHNLRQQLGLFKTPNKLSTDFSAHCVDSWVLANSVTNTQLTPDHTEVLVLKPLTFTRRQLHRFNPSKGGTRSRYGGTRSLHLKKGTLVSHPKHGQCLVGGSNGVDSVSLHTTTSYTRITQNTRPSEIHSISYSPWLLTGNTHPLSVKLERRQARRNQASLRSSLQGRNLLPALKDGVSGSLV